MTRSTADTINRLKSFITSERPKTPPCPLAAVSLFSGAGISDAGYERAGFRFYAQVEADNARASIGERNYPHSTWIVDDVRSAKDAVVAAYEAKQKTRLDLLVATPPCQGMSSSNPSRGKRKTDQAKVHDEKNRLVLAVAPIAQALRPRVIVMENVRQVLTHTIEWRGKDKPVLQVLAEKLSGYEFFQTRVNVADYGIPQTRYRALVVAVDKNEACVEILKDKRKFPWRKATHAASDGDGGWVTVSEWLKGMEYEALSARSPEEAKNGHPLHFVPNYDEDRFLLVSSIPTNSGRSAYENDVCPDCGEQDVPFKRGSCPACREPMRNRPIVRQGKRARLIKGFASSYRRMRPDQPAPTVTTNSSHVGSDNKIHPWEPRVLSILECADLQTVPRWFDWSAAIESDRKYLIRNVIGEAFPSYFTYLHGQVLARLLRKDKSVYAKLVDVTR